MDAIANATQAALPLFRLNQWTWRGEVAPPSELDIAATFSSLAWELRRDFGFNGDGARHRASTGRLLVTMEGNGDVTYSVVVGTEHAA